MSFVADLARLGILPMQHHVPVGSAPAENKSVVYGARVIGRDPSRGFYSIQKNDKSNTYGPLHGGAVWFASRQAPAAGLPTRNVPLWSQAFPARIDKSSSRTGWDLYQSKVTSSYVAVPGLDADSGSEGWRDDGGLVPQLVANPIGMQDLPVDMPGVALPTSTVDEQQMAFVPSGHLLVAVNKGGEGKYGTFVYDTTSTGRLDKTRRARLHSFLRVYRLPKSGLVPFGGHDPKVPGGLAWQLSYDVDGDAGLGVVVDKGAGGGAGKGTTGSGTSGTTGAGTGPGNSSGTTSGAPPAVGSGVAPSLGQPVNLGAGANPITLATTVAGLQKQLDQNDQQIAAAVNAGASGQAALGTLTDQRHQIEAALAKAYAAQQQAGTSSGPSGGGSAVFAAASQTVFGIFHVGDSGDPHQIASGDDGPVNCLHLNVNAPWKGDGFDAPVKSGAPWRPITSAGPLWAETLFCYDPADSHTFINGPRTGRRKWQTPIPFDTPPPTIIDGGSSVTQNGGGGGSVTQGGDGGGGVVGGGSVGGGAVGGGSVGGGGLVPGTGLTNGPLVGGGGTTVPVGGSPTGSGGVTPGGPPTGGPTDGPGGGSPWPPTTIPGLYPPVDGSGGTFVQTTGPQTYTNWGGPTPPTGSAGGGITGGRTSSVDRPYLRTPFELAAPALLARPVPLNAYGYDWRNQTATLVGTGYKAYDSAPVAGKLEAFANQSGGGFNYQGDQTRALYRRGVSSRGGFALVPANVDLQDVIQGRPLPASLSDAHLMLATTSSSFSHADPVRNGLPANGFVHNRGAQAANGSWPFTIKGALADGSVANTSIWSYGTDASGANQTGTNTVHTPSRGTGTGTGGEFQVAIGVPGTAGSIVHGATTRFRVTHTGIRFQNSDLSTMFQIDNTSGPAAFAFFGVAPVAQQSTFASLTNSTGGTPSTTYAAAPAAYNQAEQNNFRASVVTHLSAIRAALVAYGLSA